jgi:RHS repeat-associated protein
LIALSETADPLLAARQETAVVVANVLKAIGEQHKQLGGLDSGHKDIIERRLGMLSEREREVLERFRDEHLKRNSELTDAKTAALKEITKKEKELQEQILPTVNVTLRKQEAMEESAIASLLQSKLNALNAKSNALKQATDKLSQFRDANLTGEDLRKLTDEILRLKEAIIKELQALAKLVNKVTKKEKIIRIPLSFSAPASQIEDVLSVTLGGALLILGEQTKFDQLRASFEDLQRLLNAHNLNQYLGALEQIINRVHDLARQQEATAALVDALAEKEKVAKTPLPGPFVSFFENPIKPDCVPVCSGEPTYSAGIGQGPDPCNKCETIGDFAGISFDVGASAIGSNVYVFLRNGELALFAVDLEIPGRGFNWKFERKYRSGAVSGFRIGEPLGHSWEFNYNRRLVEVNTSNQDLARQTLPQAKVGDVIRMDGYTRADLYVRTPEGNYSAPTGFYTNLVKRDDGTFLERDFRGNKVVYGQTDTDGIARMTRLSDRNGNTMRFEYNSQKQLAQVIDTLGRRISYFYDSEGHLTEVRDFSQRSIKFTFDNNGDLVAVTSPAVTNTPHGNNFTQGKTTRYSYSVGFVDERLNHNLLTITAPNEVALGGPPRVIITYENNPLSPNSDRVLSLTIGGTNRTRIPAGGTLRYEYTTIRATTPGDFISPVSQTAVIDRNGNRTEYQFNQLGNIVQIREFTEGIRPSDPSFFLTRYEYNDKGELTRQIYPEGNSVEYIYDESNPDRLQQGNVLAEIRRPDPRRGGDQAFIRTTYTYEPIYNQLRSVTDPRGNDSRYVPPFGGAGSPERYTTFYTFDYQEGTNFSDLADELGVTVDELQTRLTRAGIQLGLGNINRDDPNNQRIAGNVIRVQHPTVTLLPSANMTRIEGGNQQPIVWLYQYNQYGQMTKRIDPEGNVDVYSYHPENDPDGNGRDVTPSVSNSPFGYLKEEILDTEGDLLRNSRTNPEPVNIRKRYFYDQVGNVTREINGRGIETRYFVNELNQTVQITRAFAHNLFEPDPPEPLSLMDFQYVERIFYDFNNNIVLKQVEDRGNTSSVDGNPPRAELPPNVSNPDPLGGLAFVDTVVKHDILDNQIEIVEEVANGTTPVFLRTRSRYDRNENIVMVIQPAGNATASVYDERDLLFQSISGAITRSPQGLYALNDPTRFNRPGDAGAEPSIITYNYDKNRNLSEIVDADDTDENAANNSTIAGVGDATKITYDGFDRLNITSDRLGTLTTNIYDPASNVVRVITDGDPVDDVVGSNENKTLAVTEYIHDELSRIVATHEVLFHTPDVAPLRTPILTDTPAMDSLAPYLSDAPSDTAPVPGAIGIVVIGRVTTLMEYDRNERPIFEIQDDLDVYRTDYDGPGRIVGTIDSTLSNGFNDGTFNPANLAGNSLEMAYDDNSNLIEQKETDVTTLPGVESEVFRTTFLYDSLDRLQTRVDSLGQTEDYRYDSRDNQVAKADAVGPVSTRTVNRRGLGSTVEVLVNDFGNVTRMRYDGIGREVENETLLTASGQGNGVYVGADLEGRNIAPPPRYLDTTQSGDGVISVYYAWNFNSQLLAKRDDNGNTTAYIFDNKNRTRVERMGLTFTGATFTLAGGESGSFNTSLRGGVTSVNTEPIGTVTTFTYDPDDNIIAMEDEAGNSFVCSYDAENQKKDCQVDRVAGFIGTTRQAWKYDGLGRETECFDNNEPVPSGDDVICRNFYDSLSRKIEEQQQIGLLSVKAVSCNFDISVGRAIFSPSSCLYPDGRRINNTYDRLDRLVSRRDDGQSSDIGRYEYLGIGREAVLTYQNNTRLTHIGHVGGRNVNVGFDRLRRPINRRWEQFTAGDTSLGNDILLIGFEHQDGNGNLRYDRADNRLIEYKTHDPTNSEQYKFDSAYRLTSPASGMQRLNARGFERGEFTNAYRTSMTNVNYYQDWDFDGAGNWTRQDDNGRVESRNHSDFNEIVQRIVSGNRSVVTHDKNGNTTNTGYESLGGQALPGGGLRIEYDAFNRARKVSRNNNTPENAGDDVLIAEYTYDSQNRRMRKVVLNSNALNGTTDFYYYEWQVVEERDGSDRVAQQYVYGNYIDEVWTVDNRRDAITVSQLNDGTGRERLFHHSNILYHVYALTNETGTPLKIFQYDAFGKRSVVVDNTESVILLRSNNYAINQAPQDGESPYAFTGQRLDLETNLQYYKNRYYSPQLGRFLHRDPLDPVMAHYSYSGNNPVMRIDPSGNLWWFVGVAWAAAKVIVKAVVKYAVTAAVVSAPIVIPGIQYVSPIVQRYAPRASQYGERIISSVHRVSSRASGGLPPPPVQLPSPSVPSAATRPTPPTIATPSSFPRPSVDPCKPQSPAMPMPVAAPSSASVATPVPAPRPAPVPESRPRYTTIRGQYEHARKAQKAQIQRLGRIEGCRSCGNKTASIYHADHMPPTKFDARRGGSLRNPQYRFGAHCPGCSNAQSHWVRGAVNRYDTRVPIPH